MRIFGILFLFLNLVGAVSIFSGNIPVATYPDTPTSAEISYPSHFQQSVSLKVGDGLPFSYVPQRPVVRTLQYYFEHQPLLNPYSAFSDFFILPGGNRHSMPAAISSS